MDLEIEQGRDSLIVSPLETNECLYVQIRETDTREDGDDVASIMLTRAEAQKLVDYLQQYLGGAI